ncbi:D-amino-acid oxidase [Mycena sanguinolenta]|uniref:D-amino-acid oxidase n=1 Tax=Mycena sanguinolenta TaxID=230812 RepID=A0A8H6X3N4_9AGAR|nr:D-amino-acid oxidase [Mycena sanguinolenta]KAF7377382.1 D-amino-acid oxidase [Mycena sanguinolenta]
MPDSHLDVFVVGAGVIGLSTAIRALEAGFDVTIFAEWFPGDEKNIAAASCWAGADHVSGIAASDDLMYTLEKETFDELMKLLKKDPLIPVMVRPHMRYTQAVRPDDKLKNEHLSRFYSDFRLLNASELPETVVCGAMFSTLCIDVPRYLPYLMNRFVASGGRAFRTKLPSISALFSEKDRPPLTAFPATTSTTPPTFSPVPVINCTGLGALSLGDVLDTAMYPTRGEILIIRAPWANRDCTFHWEDGHTSYMIPRQSGDVVLGGTFQPDDWHSHSRPETVQLIKQRCIQAFPELLPSGTNDLEVIEECVGFRPTRKGGVRLEIGSLAGVKIIPVVHNYGHGGAGYQSSWGSANLAVELLKSVVQASNVPTTM